MSISMLDSSLVSTGISKGRKDIPNWDDADRRAPFKPHLGSSSSSRPDPFSTVGTHHVCNKIPFSLSAMDANDAHDVGKCQECNGNVQRDGDVSGIAENDQA